MIEYVTEIKLNNQNDAEKMALILESAGYIINRRPAYIGITQRRNRFLTQSDSSFGVIASSIYIFTVYKEVEDAQVEE